MAMLIPFLMSCRKPIVLQLEPDISPAKIESVDEFEPAGRLTNDTYVDFDHDLAVPILSGWTLEIGKRNEAFRLRLKHAEESDLEIEFWSFEGRYDEPIPSDKCQWSFIDIGYYSKYSVGNKTIVASCEYNYQSSLVYAVIIPTETQTWQIEIHTPSLNMISNLDAAHLQLQKASIISGSTTLSPTNQDSKKNYTQE